MENRDRGPRGRPGAEDRAPLSIGPDSKLIALPSPFATLLPHRREEAAEPLGGGGADGGSTGWAIRAAAPQTPPAPNPLGGCQAGAAVESARSPRLARLQPGPGELGSRCPPADAVCNGIPLM